MPRSRAGRSVLTRALSPSWLVSLLFASALVACAHAPPPCPACPPPPAPALKASEDLAELTRKLYVAMGSGRPEEVEAFYSAGGDVVFVGLAASEFWTDSAQHNADLRPRQAKAGLKLTPSELLAWEQGDLGWVVDRPEVQAPNGFTYRMRVTLLWRREAGQWKVFHSHASVASR